MYTRYEVYKKEKKKGLTGNFLKTIIKLSVFTLLFSFLISRFFIRGYKLENNSMYPTVKPDHDSVIVLKCIYGLRIPFSQKRILKIIKPRINDIILLKHPNLSDTLIVKRIIGRPGDVVEIKNKKVFINNIEQKEIFAYHSRSDIFPAKLSPSDNFGPVRIRDDAYFIMGDNRDENYDSRWYGPVNSNLIVGKTILRYFPFKRWKFL